MSAYSPGSYDGEAPGRRRWVLLALLLLAALVGAALGVLAGGRG